jgi:hypothetical protein
MRVQIQVLQPEPDFQNLLQSDGWQISIAPDGSMLAVHPAVVSEPGARARLNRLGLLTSVKLRIHFDSSSPSCAMPHGSIGGPRRSPKSRESSPIFS